MSKKTLRLWSVLLSVFLVVSMIPTMVFAGSEDAIEIVSQPESITASAGEQKDLSVVAENATSYQWQRSSDNGQNWSNIGSTNSNYTNAKTDTMTVKVNKTTAGFVYKCVVKNSAGSVSTEIVSVTLLQQLEITAQPNNITGISRDEKVMKVTATNASSYQWQRSSDDGESWSNIGSSNVNYSNAKTAALTIKINKNTAGFVYRCVVKNSENTVNSEAATVTVILPVVIKTEPKDISSPSGEEKTMSVVAENATSYQWQRSSDNGETWSNIGSTNSNYTNAKTDTMTIKVNKTTAGFVYRCVVKNSAFTEYTKEASVNVAEPVQELNITAQPEDISGQIGEAKTMSVEVTNATSYQWQRSADGQTWSNISTSNSNYSGAKTSALTININKNTVSYVYRCVAKNSGFTENSEPASVSVAEPAQPLEITEQPESIVGKAGDEKTMIVAATNATSYQWQRSSDDGATWSNIGTTNSNYSGVKTEELSVKINKNTAAYIYRCVVKNDSGDSLASEVACVELKATITLTLDANGGLIYGDPTVTRIKEQNSYFFNDTEDAPVREGYVFDGWCLDKDGLEPIGFSCLVTEDLTLYARWIKGDRCTVTVNANGGEFSSGEQIYSVAVDKESYIYAYISYDTIGKVVLEEPTRAGYVFDGWCLDAECQTYMGLSYYVTKDMTVYASWKEACTITFNANGGKFYNGEQTYSMAVEKNKCTYGPSPEMTGFVFQDWYLDAECTEPANLGSNPVTKNMTVYAKWTEAVNVTFVANGGYFFYESVTTETYAVAKNSCSGYTHPSHESLVFDCWCLDPECTEEVDVLNYVITSDVTFYAKWVEGVNVTWDGNGGYIGVNTTITTDTRQVPPNRPIQYDMLAERAGYTLEGWYLDKACTEKVVFGEYVVTRDVTFYAKWIEVVTVTFDANGGRFDNGALTYSVSVAKNGYYSYYSTPDPNRDGYVFDGWYLNADCTGDEVYLYEYAITEDVTFYAKWVDPLYVTWDANGGYIWGDSDYPTYTILVAENYVVEDPYLRAEKDGYVIEGWYLDAEFTEEVDRWDYIVTGNVTFYAKWVEAVYVTWDANGGYFNEGARFTESIQKYRVLGSVTEPKHNAYAFAGWYFDAQCTEPVDLYEYAIVENITFYAKWVEPVYVTWNANGGHIWVNGEMYAEYTGKTAKNEIYNYSYESYREGYILLGWYLDPEFTVVRPYNFAPSENTTLYAKWEKAISVTWNANGGYIWGNEDFPSYTEYVRKNQAIGYRQTASRAGYAFDGWYLDEDCTESVDPQYYAPSGDVIFYAKWVEAVYVTWNAKGGYIWGDEDHPTYTEPVAKNQRIGYTQSIEREGFDFVGWYLDEDCTESVDPEDYVPETDVTFYAKWREIKDVTVTFDANGGIYRSNAKVSYTLEYDRYVSELFEEDERFYQTVLKDGYYFEDWYLDADCTESVDVWDYRATEDVTFYAKWVEAAHVTWNANGGYFSLDGGGTAATMTVNARPGYPIGEYPVPEREGYSFDGWYLDAYSSESVDTWWYNVSEDVTLYAKWADNVNVTLDANGGCFGGDPESTTIRESVKKDSYFVIGDYNHPEREGYVFVGWYLEPDFMTRVYYDHYIFEETTFYAKWAEAVYITWNGNGGYYLGDTSAPTYTTPAAKGEPLYSDGYTFLRENYILDDWCLDANCTESVDIYEYVPSQNVTLYAKWVEAVTVTWDANGGIFWSEAGEQVPTQMVMVGKGRSVNEYLTPHRTDYEFVGWYLDANCTEEVDVWNYPVNQDVTFYAKWVEPVYATVTWDANGGYYWGDESYQIYEESVLVNNTPNSISVYRPNYSFVGWCLDEECTETVDWWNYTVTGDVTFYAKWAETAAVTWNGNGGYIFGDSDYPEYVELCSKDDAIGHVVSVERENYILDGWYLDADCTESVDPQTYVPTTDVEFFAKWIPIND